MTLGRSSTGAIKIKTDSPGLRAVECGCCQSDPCTAGNQHSIPITQATLNKWLTDGFISCQITGSESVWGQAYNYDSGIFQLTHQFPGDPTICPVWQGSKTDAIFGPNGFTGQYYLSTVYLRRNNSQLWIDFFAEEFNSGGGLSNQPFDVPSPTWPRDIASVRATLNGSLITVYGASSLPDFGRPDLNHYDQMSVSFS